MPHSVCQYIVASVNTALPDSQVANKVLIAFVCFYIYFFASSWYVSSFLYRLMCEKNVVFLDDLDDADPCHC